MRFIPTDLLRDVCSDFLDARSVLAFTFTCKENWVVLDDFSFEFRDNGLQPITTSLLKALVDRSWFVKVLSIDFGQEEDDTAINRKADLQLFCSAIEGLVVYNLTSQEPGFTQLVLMCHNLRAIRFDNCWLTSFTSDQENEFDALFH